MRRVRPEDPFWFDTKLRPGTVLGLLPKPRPALDLPGSLQQGNLNCYDAVMCEAARIDMGCRHSGREVVALAGEGIE
jgi:hypothetical protein